MVAKRVTLGTMSVVPRPAVRSTVALRGLRRRLSLLACLLLSGCAAGDALPNVLYVAIGTNTDQVIDADLLEDFRARLHAMETGYRQIHPNTRFQFSLYPEADLPAAMLRRTRAGLGPDLVLANGDTAQRLLEAGLVDPFPSTPQQLHMFQPQALARLRNKKGQLAGLPVVVQTQMACFNRKRLSVPPTSLQALLQTSASGHAVGLSMEISELFWTVGSLGAVGAVERAIAERPSSATDRQLLTRWLTWLQEANTQQRITFYANQPTAEQDLIAGRIDWLPCRSTSLPRLRRSMGAALGVAALPDSPLGEASPISRLRVWSLGKSSSVEGRQRALSFTRFSVNPLTQRSLTLGSQTLLPANRFVKVPVSSSMVLAAMVRAAAQGEQTNALVTLLQSNDLRLGKLQNLLTELVFGEVAPRSASGEVIQILHGQP